jgi:hypothetical protein
MFSNMKKLLKVNGCFIGISLYYSFKVLNDLNVSQ